MEKVTMEQIARLAGVSQATVSRAASGSGSTSKINLEKIRAAMRELGCLQEFPIGESGKDTRNIGVIVPEIAKPFYARMIGQIEKYAAKKGYSILLGSSHTSPERERECISAMELNRVDGVILASVCREALPCHLRLKKDKIPCVLFDEKICGMDYDAGVFVDNEFAVFNAVDYLIRNRRHKIAFISGGEEHSVTKERLNGYRSALQLHGLNFDGSRIKYGQYSIRSGYRMVQELLQSRTDFTALVAGSDMVSLGAMQALKHYRVKIPEGVQVIGFDNAGLGEMVDPGLTAIVSPIAEMAREAVECLACVMRGGALEGRDRRMDARLILRGSTRAADDTNKTGSASA